MSLANRPLPSQALQQRGFTLLELAVVILVIGLMIAIGSYLVPWINEEQSRERTRGGFDEADAAIRAFARTHHRLPCPATSPTAGTENCAPGNTTGFVPFETLLLSAPVQDSAHNPVVYSIYRHPANADLGVRVNLFDALDEPAGTINACDFCEALRNASPASGSGYTSVSDLPTTGGCAAGDVTNQAYVLASHGPEDRDGLEDRPDGDNLSALPNCFASPIQGRSDSYDDIVQAVSFTDLIGALCP